MHNIVLARDPAAQQMFSVAKAKRQQQMFSVAKAKRQLQSAQSEQKSTTRFGDDRKSSNIVGKVLK
ncbi:hypothetical protein [Lysinibacillus sp. Ag94]|uniref:hypothetical protein n=1 Tax=Lysinibacillus sp. Ag94 TaxID=2936682 RepID=UPI00200FCACD|nr:hypothetical protein [Lysinibacillus sp. Ag94]UPW84979.1 hypothetical protein MY533_09075 [Lysinibacillus sp. Ag94]